jgi:carnitine O-acetyltransferase
MTTDTRDKLPSPATFGNDDRLPHVPLPTLEDTCARFLEWCAPLLTVDELATTESAVAAFLEPTSPARTLHAALAEFAASPGVHSWLDLFWPYRYLGRRDRIALNANFFFHFTDTGEGQVERAANLVTAALDYKRRIDDETLPPETLRGKPLSMVQNKYLFSATRIPGEVIDSARTPYSEEWPGPSRERHILVFVRGHMFRMDVIGPDGHAHTLDELAAGFRAARAAGAVRAAAGTSVGHLTTKARAEWAASRAALQALDPANTEALDTIERALFCLALEDLAPADAREACDHLLHGDSANRWFDKALTFVVFADGSAGLNGEHCNLDGTTMVSLINDALGLSAQQHERNVGARSQGEPIVAPVEFVLDDSLRADIEGAAASFADYAAACASATVSIDGFTSTRSKALHSSPDAFCQLAFQLAHKRAKGHVGATYESIATRGYQNGRTEALRVVTPEIVAFTDAMDDPAAGDVTRRAAFRAAAEKHVARAKECQLGQAPEQHLWEMQLIARRLGAELGVTESLALYDSPGWLIMRDDYLSTSAVPSPLVKFFGFGSTSQKCIGIGYGLTAERFGLYLSTPRSVADQMYLFADALRYAVAELDALLAAELTG